MVDNEQVKHAAVTVLNCIENVSSFAATINPLFHIVTSLVTVAKMGIAPEDAHKLDEDFRAVQDKLKTISQANQVMLQQIRLDEVNETYGKHEESIKHQYGAFITMVEKIKKDPEGSKRYMDDFKSVYEKDKEDNSLGVFYRGITGSPQFGQPLLEVYLNYYGKNRAVMEARCSQLAHLIHIGLVTLMAHTAITEDDLETVKEKWETRGKEIQAKMDEVLDQCDGN